MWTCPNCHRPINECEGKILVERVKQHNSTIDEIVAFIERHGDPALALKVGEAFVDCAGE
jgi:hypothetical protein